MCASNLVAGCRARSLRWVLMAKVGAFIRESLHRKLCNQSAQNYFLAPEIRTAGRDLLASIASQSITRRILREFFSYLRDRRSSATLINFHEMSHIHATEQLLINHSFKLVCCATSINYPASSGSCYPPAFDWSEESCWTFCFSLESHFIISLLPFPFPPGELTATTRATPVNNLLHSSAKCWLCEHPEKICNERKDFPSLRIRFQSGKANRSTALDCASFSCEGIFSLLHGKLNSAGNWRNKQRDKAMPWSLRVQPTTMKPSKQPNSV